MASFQSIPLSAPSLRFADRRRHLALSLPRWATDCLRRADPTIPRNRPLVLWEKLKGGMRLAAVDALASRAGLSVGQNLTDARALLPDLLVHELDRDFTAHVFSEFADWHSNASPIVAVLDSMAPYGDLILDITGVAHLFGGEPRMLETLTGRLRQLGYTTHGAIADTVGAAWAFAHFDPGRVVPESQLEADLSGLPVDALRLGETQVAGLNQMGLKSVGQLYGRDRKALQARFGASLVTRLDQALGLTEERVTPRVPIAEYYAERRFAEPIGYLDDVLMTVRDLAIQLGVRLGAEGLGAQSFHLFLYRVDHKVMTMSVNAARATRDPSHIAQLFVHRSERLESEYDAGFGIDMIRLAAGSLSPTPDVQVGAFEIDDGAQDLTRLYDRMTSRLGPLAVVLSKPIDTHFPERAVRLEPVVARTPDDPGALLEPPVRPLRLLPTPEPVEVIAEVPHGPPLRMVWRRLSYRVLKASGPERIEAEWWRTGQKLDFLSPPVVGEASLAPQDHADPARTPVKPEPLAEHVSRLESFDAETTLRDYYIVEDDGGRRFWVFRVGLYGAAAAPRWYLHGFFA
jgi:protein ImuB